MADQWVSEYGNQQPLRYQIRKLLSREPRTTVQIRIDLPKLFQTATLAGSSVVAADLVRIVNQSTANRTLFSLRTVDEFRASFATRDEGADLNVWLYSYNRSRLS